MAVEFVEFHAELRSVAGDLLAKDRAVDWTVLAEAGWTGLEVAEDLGGAGATFAETAVICEEMGRAASVNNYLGSAVLAVGVLNALQPSDIRNQLLSDVGSGARRVAVALGSLDFVPDAVGADRLLVVTTDAEGVPVVVDSAGLTVTPQPVVDETRRLAAVSADRLDTTEALRFEGDPGAQVRLLLDRAAVAIACDSLGLSEAMLSATTSYAKVRHQFDRPIGSFQAVKHACADMLVKISVSRQLVGAAVDAIARGPTGRRCCGRDGEVVRHHSRGGRRRQGHAATRRHRIHVGERRPRLPQARRAQPFTVRITCGSPQTTGSTLSVEESRSFTWAYPFTSAFSTSSRPRVSTRCSASRTRTSCTCSPRPMRAAGRW